MFKDFLKEINPQSQINKIAKKYKNKKIIVYGAGQYAQFILDNYDLSNLQIVGFSDKSFKENKGGLFYNYPKISPYEIKNTNADIIFTLVANDYQIYEYLTTEILKSSLKIKIDVLLKPNFIQIIRFLFNKF